MQQSRTCRERGDGRHAPARRSTCQPETEETDGHDGRRPSHRWRRLRCHTFCCQALATSNPVNSGRGHAGRERPGLNQSTQRARGGSHACTARNACNTAFGLIPVSAGWYRSVGPSEQVLSRKQTLHWCEHAATPAVLLPGRQITALWHTFPDRGARRASTARCDWHLLVPRVPRAGRTAPTSRASFAFIRPNPCCAGSHANTSRAPLQAM